MNWIVKKYLLWSGKRYWYQVKIFYKNNNGDMIMNATREIGLLNRNHILKHREVKEMFNASKVFRSSKKYLCNGIMYFEVNSYLGLLKNEH